MDQRIIIIYAMGSFSVFCYASISIYAFAVHLDDAYSNKDLFKIHENRTNNRSHTDPTFYEIQCEEHCSKQTRKSSGTGKRADRIWNDSLAGS